METNNPIGFFMIFFTYNIDCINVIICAGKTLKVQSKVIRKTFQLECCFKNNSGSIYLHLAHKIYPILTYTFRYIRIIFF